MKKGIDTWSDYDRCGNWMLCIGKKRGKLSLDEIKQAAQEYECDFYVMILDCTDKEQPFEDRIFVPNNDGTTTEYSDLVQLYPMDRVWKK